MLLAKKLLEALSNTENEEDFKHEKDDYDFVEVMKFYEETHMTKNEVNSFINRARTPATLVVRDSRNRMSHNCY